MAKVTVTRPGGPGAAWEAREGETLKSFLSRHGLELDAPCAGRGRCGKCRLAASGALSAPGPGELELLAGHPGQRLACQAKILGDCAVGLAAEGAFSAVAGLGRGEPYPVASPLAYRRLAAPGRRDSRDLLALGGLKSATLPALKGLAALDGERQGALATLWGDELLRAEPLVAEGEEPPLWAAAVDVGTTGLAVAILDARTGAVVAQGTALNPQTARGADVISRITVAAEGPAGLADLQTLVLGGVAALVGELAGDRADRVMAVAVAGNTTMTYLLAGLPPKGLAQAPYRLVTRGSLDLSPLAGRLGVNPLARVFTAPPVSAYVGGDITAGLLAVGLQKRPGTTLFIDIGTNGEIALAHHGRLIATSCAAGPALEGMNIACGQRATTGAIEAVEPTPAGGLAFSTIGGGPATGLCGSGLIDLTAALLRSGRLDKSGRLAGGRLDLADGVYFTQKDVRQVQLVKGAVAAATGMLLERAGLAEGDLGGITIAGSFGFHLKAESLRAIGLIPPSYEGPVAFAGNSSLAGAARMLLDGGAMGELGALAAGTQALELGFEPAFQSAFVRHLGF